MKKLTALGLAACLSSTLVAPVSATETADTLYTTAEKILNNLGNTQHQPFDKDWAYDYGFAPGTGIKNTFEHIRSLVSYSELQALLPFEIYTSGPHSRTELDLENTQDFGRYNLQFVENLEVGLSSLVENEDWLRSVAPKLRDTGLIEKLERFAEMHEYIENNFPEFENIRDIYADKVAEGTWPQGGHYQYLPNKLSGEKYWYWGDDTYFFWLRRDLDGTRIDFYNIVTTLLNALASIGYTEFGEAVGETEVTSSFLDLAALKNNSAEKALTNITSAVIANLDAPKESPDARIIPVIEPDTGLLTSFEFVQQLISVGNLTSILGMPIYVQGPHSDDYLNLNSQQEFGHYNPKFVATLKAVMTSLSQNDDWLKANAAMLQKHGFLKKLDWFVEIHEYIEQNPDEFARLVGHYEVRLEFNDWPEYGTYQYLPRPLKADRYWYWGEDIYYFWVRRSVDGTRDDWISIVTQAKAGFDRVLTP